MQTLQVDDAGETMILPRGQFFGECEVKRELDGVTLAALLPRVPEREVGRHTHADAHFVYVTAGTYLSTAVGAPPVAPAPTLIYNPPGTTHRDRFRSEGGRFFTISLGARRLAEIQALARLPGRARWIGHPRARAAVWRLARECLHWDDTSPLVVDGLTWTLADATIPAGPTRESIAPWLLRVRDRLHDTCAGPLRLAGLATDAGVHPGHLTRSFREAFGCTPGEYQRVCRLERAIGLVRTTQAPLAEIAVRCGFSDQSHLTRDLRRHRALTPAQLRR